jgi:hypothetical protein
MGIKGIPLLSVLRQEFSFPVFVPTTLPPHFIPQSITEGNGVTMPSDTVTIDYKDAESSTGLELFEGPAGCCVDQDVRKYVGPVRLPNGVTVYRPSIGADNGSSSLMWDQAGTFVAREGTPTAPCCCIHVERRTVHGAMAWSLTGGVAAMDDKSSGSKR